MKKFPETVRNKRGKSNRSNELNNLTLHLYNYGLTLRYPPLPMRFTFRCGTWYDNNPCINGLKACDKAYSQARVSARNSSR